MVYRKTNRSTEAPRSRAGATSPVVTTKDVARATSISATTVASILSGRDVVRVSEATRDRVLATAREMGYRRNGLASALRTGRTDTIGIVSPLAWGDVGDGLRAPYLTQLLSAIGVAATRAGRNAMTFVETPFAELPAGAVADGRVDGVVLFGVAMDLPHAAAWVREMYDTGLPCVEIGSRYGRYQVHADNVGGARLAVRHLLGLGHRRIAYWSTFKRIVSSESRVEGFVSGTRAAGLSGEESPVIYTDEELRTLLRLPADRRPTAVFCCNDSTAVAALDRIREAGLRVPEDVSLVGFDNGPYAEVMRPRLTSVENPLRAMAEAAVALILAQQEGGEVEPPCRLVETRLAVRESTAPPPH